MRQPRKLVFWFLLLVGDLVVIAVIVAAYLSWRLPDGVALNQLAWQRSFTERGLTPPAGGPREGYWGDKLTDHRINTQFGILALNTSEPGKYDFDDRGAQHARPTVRDSLHPPIRLLIMGGSVANGAYASDISHTYWSLLAEYRATSDQPLEITVWGAGGWTSVQEVPAMQWLITKESFDAVLFLNGLNDITQRVDTPLAQRLEQYLENMKRAADFLAARHIPMFVAPQPYLPAKKTQTRIEQHIMTLHRFEAVHQFAFEGLLVGLRELEAGGAIHLIDCSGVFNDETATTFTDIWHFSDPGHVLLAEHLARHLRLDRPADLAPREPARPNPRQPAVVRTS